MRYDFLVESYETERMKVVSVWAGFETGFAIPTKRERPGRACADRWYTARQRARFRTYWGSSGGAGRAVGRVAAGIHKAVCGFGGLGVTQEEAWWEGIRCSSM
jgi:hypothetical protein